MASARRIGPSVVLTDVGPTRTREFARDRIVEPLQPGLLQRSISVPWFVLVLLSHWNSHGALLNGLNQCFCQSTFVILPIENSIVFGKFTPLMLSTGFTLHTRRCARRSPFTPRQSTRRDVGAFSGIPQESGITRARRRRD